MIPEIRKILYATDLTKNSAYAGVYVMELARQFDAKVVVVHVIEPATSSAWLALTAQSGQKEKMEKDQFEKSMEVIQDRLDRYCKAVGKDESCLNPISKILVRIGRPVEEILNAAEEENCDIFVLGSHGKGFLKHTFLGSVSRMVLDRSRKPVIVIPLPEGEFEWEEIA